MINSRKRSIDFGVIESTDGILLRMWSVFVPTGTRTLRRHSHVAFEIAYIKGGSGVYSIHGTDYTMHTGDIFVFSSNEQHCITSIGESGLELINLQFEPRYLWGSSFDRMTEQHANFCFSHNKNFHNYIPCDSTKNLPIYFDAIASELKSPKSESALMVKSYLNLILISLIRDFNYAGDDTSLSRNHLHSIRRIISYIDANLSENLSLAQLSEISGWSPNYLSALFHKTSGISLWDYINAKRIDAATRLLLNDPTMNMIDIAIQCGFNNTANFNKCFRKVTGMTPTEYRKFGSDL